MKLKNLSQFKVGDKVVWSGCISRVYTVSAIGTLGEGCYLNLTDRRGVRLLEIGNNWFYPEYIFVKADNE